MRAIWPGVLLVVYLFVTGALLIAGWSRVRPAGVAIHFAMLGVVAGATWLHGVPRWLRAWTPLLALLFLYAEVPMLIRAAGHLQPYDWAVMRWEAALFNSQPAFEWAARWPSRPVSELLHLAYLGYYPVIFVVPAVLYAGARHDDFSEATFVLLCTFVVCFLAFVAFPVAGPRYLWPSRASDGPIRDLVRWILETRSSHGTAFPSSHVAVALTQSILAFRYFGVRGAPVLVVAVGLAVGAIYGGFHYAVDVLAGAAVGAATTVFGLRFARRMPSGEGQRANVSAADMRP